MGMLMYTKGGTLIAAIYTPFLANTPLYVTDTVRRPGVGKVGTKGSTSFSLAQPGTPPVKSYRRSKSSHGGTSYLPLYGDSDEMETIN